ESGGGAGASHRPSGRRGSAAGRGPLDVCADYRREHVLRPGTTPRAIATRDLAIHDQRAERRPLAVVVASIERLVQDTEECRPLAIQVGDQTSARRRPCWPDRGPPSPPAGISTRVEPCSAPRGDNVPEPPANSN